jgi:Ca2+-binding RTX toxin-like protein
MPTFTGAASGDTFTAPDNQDWTIIGKGGADSLTGGGGNDTFDAGKGNDTLNGGGGDDTFLVGTLGGFDVFDGGDTAYVGASGYDVIKATADGVKIGIESITGIDEITANGFANVQISGSANANIMDFSKTLLTGITKISGGAGDDTIIGSAGADVIDGGTGNDSLSGGAGDDIFLIGANAGTDTIDGGAGFDTVQAAVNNAHINYMGLKGIEAIDGGAYYNVEVVGSDGDDVMTFKTTTLTNIMAIDGGAGNDTITGTAFDDTIYGGDGDDSLVGGAGNDTFNGGKGHDILVGGAGDDSFYTSDGADVYNGGAGYDVVYASRNGAAIEVDKGLLVGIEEISANGFTGVTIKAANAAGSLIDLRHIYVADDDIASINGGVGNDTIYGSHTYDYIFGGNGNDSINGFYGDDELHGGLGNDTIIGGGGYDVLYGDAGNDVLNGGADDDVLYGGAGNDTLIASANGGWDEFHGDAGFDTILADDGVKVIKIYAMDGIEAISWDGTHLATIQAYFGDDNLDFSGVTLTGISAIDASDGNDYIVGSKGSETILGGNGNDTLSGNAGDDILTGGAGTDVLTGGTGHDVFSDNIAGLNGDRITDFSLDDAIRITNAGNWSKVVLSWVEDDSGTSGTLHITGGNAPKAGIDIHLDGVFTTGSFEVVSDGATGALIHLVGETPLI